MSYAEKLARFVYWCVWPLVSIGIAALVWHTAARVPVDPQTGSAGLAVEIDAGTGCQYVVTPWGGIFARLDTDGKPLCRKSP